MDIPRRKPRADLRRELKLLLTEPGPYLSVFYGAANHPLPVTERAESDLADLPLTPAQRLTARAHLDEVQLTDAELAAVVVASSGRAVALEFPDPPAHDHVSLEALPRLGPILEADQGLVHHVVAVIGEEEIDIITVPRRGSPSTHRLTFGGDADVAGLITQVVEASETTLLVLAGVDRFAMADLRADLRRRIPLSTYIADIDSALLDDESTPDLADEVVRAVADLAARRTVDMLRLWRFQHTAGRACDGVLDVARALASGQAGVLLVHDDVDDERQAWFGRDFRRVAIDLDDATPVDPSEALQPGRLPDVFVRAALGQDIPALLIPGIPDDRLADGVGVLLDPDARP